MDRKPHLVHIMNTPQFGGVQHTVLHLATCPELQAYQHSIICVVSPEGDLSETFQQKGISIYFCPFLWSNFNFIPSYTISRWLRHRMLFSFSWRLSALLRKRKVDIVHSHISTNILYQARAILSYTHTPLIWTVHGLHKSIGLDVSQWASTIKLVNTSCAVITGDSKRVLEEFDGMGIDPRKFQEVNVAVDSALFRQGNHRDPSWRDQWGIPQDACVFGSAGRLVEVKSQDLFVSAAAAFLQKEQNAHFVLAGSGPLFDQLQAQVRSLGIEDKFHLIGFQQDMVQFLQECDVFVLTSKSEGLPLAIIEACAMGVPCISTDVGGVSQVLQDGAGILVPYGAVDKLTEAMLRMFKPDIRQQYASKTLAAASNFTVEKMANTYGALYNNLLHCQE